MTETAPPITGLYPPWNFPTIFADNVTTLTSGSGVVRFYFARLDPVLSGNAQPNISPVCQVVMPSISFAAMTVFFQQQLEFMMQRNEIPAASVEKLKEMAAQEIASQMSQPQRGQHDAS